MGIFNIFRKKPHSDAWLGDAIQSAGNRAQQAMLSGLNTAKRGFQIAETPAWTNSWSTTGTELNEELAAHLPVMRARSRQMARDNEWAVRYVLQLVDNVLGPQGIRLQMRLPKINENPNPSNEVIENAWWTWGQRGTCEVTGKLTWQELEKAALESLARDGELLIRLRHGVGAFGFQLQLLNPAILDVAHHGTHQGRRIRMGIEITDEGRPVAYWLRAAKSGESPTSYTVTSRHMRIPAEEIIHAFEVHEIDQLRGIPWLTVGARRLWLMQDFEESAAVASSNAAKRQGFFVSPSGDAPPGFADTIVSSVLDAARAAGKVLTPDEIKRLTDAAEKYSTTMPGQFDTLPLGYDFKPFESDWPNIDASSYIKQGIRGWAAARGMSYVTVGNDLEAVNYSSARVGIIDEREHYKSMQANLISWLHSEVLRRWMPYAALVTPGLSSQRVQSYLFSATWQPRRWVGIDPLKEANAHRVNLELGLTSRRRLQIERGDDPDEIASEIAEERELYGDVPNALTFEDDGVDE